jgi:hypothetical protein
VTCERCGAIVGDEIRHERYHADDEQVAQSLAWIVERLHEINDRLLEAGRRE